MTVEEDRSADRRILIAVAATLVMEVVFAVLADAGTYPLWVWLVLAIGGVLAAGAAWSVVEHRTEGTPLWKPGVRPPRD